eukprot:TRINITY_DN1178_c1_g1_i1.p1 TRINITY_DN1178_c1_g1~~TRINITY_DN1178_c1_g1_i1.p1  ORF type:complete len:739 (+),score=125.51 TRINITY_DN1178_c1_g1_i1:77-2293(+)
MGCLLSSEEGVFNLLDRAYGVRHEEEKLVVNMSFGDKREIATLSKLVHYSVDELNELAEHYFAITNSDDGKVDSREVLWDFLVRPPYMNYPDINPVIAAAICERVSEDEKLNFAVCAQLLSTLQRGSCEEQLTFLFTILDTDNSGWLLHSDLALLVDMYDASLATQLTDQPVADSGESRRQRVLLQLLAVLDVNDSGRIEFVQVMNNSLFVSKALGIEDSRASPDDTVQSSARVENSWKTLQDGLIVQRVRKSLITSKLRRRVGVCSVESVGSDGDSSSYQSPALSGVQNSSFEMPESPLGTPRGESRRPLGIGEESEFASPSTCASPAPALANARQMSFFQFKRHPTTSNINEQQDLENSTHECLSQVASDISAFRSPFQLSSSIQIDKAPRRAKPELHQASSPSLFDEPATDAAFCLHDPIILGTQINRRMSLSQSILDASSLRSLSPQTKALDTANEILRFDLDAITGPSDPVRHRTAMSPCELRRNGSLALGRVQSAATLERHTSLHRSQSSGVLLRQESVPVPGVNAKRRMSTMRKKKRRGDAPGNIAKLSQLKRPGNSISQELDGRPTSVDELLGLVQQTGIQFSPPESLLSVPTTVGTSEPGTPVLTPPPPKIISITAYETVAAVVALIASIRYFAAPQVPVPVPPPSFRKSSGQPSETSEEILLELASLSPKSQVEEQKIVLPGISEVTTEMSGSISHESPWSTSVSVERPEHPLLPPTPGWAAAKQPSS